MRNSEFLSAIYGRLRDDYGWTTSFASDPSNAPPSVWAGTSWAGTESQKVVINKRGEDNNYFCVSVMLPKDGQKRRSKDNFGRLAVLLADDADLKALNGASSYALETSPSKFQIGILLDAEDEDTKNQPLIDAVLHAMAADGLIAADPSGNNPVRYARLPIGTNTKKRETGLWSTRLLFCNLDEVYSLADAVATFGLDLDAIKRGLSAPKPKPEGTGDAVDLFKAIINPNLEERSYHDALMKLSASFIASGLKPGATVNALRSIMLASKPEEEGPELDRWRDRFGDELVRMVQGAEKYTPKEPEPVTNLKLLETIDEVDEATKSVRWLVKSLIGMDNLICLFGASGSFKSFLCIDLAMSVAHGIDWTKRKTVQGGVVYLAAEGGSGISKRIRAWNAKNGLWENPKNFHICRVPLLLTAKEEIGALRKAIAALPEIPILVIIDTLAMSFSGDENSSSDIGTYLRMINTEIKSAFNCTVIVVHHTGHNATERPRGSSAITANVDGLLGCYRSSSEGMNARLDVMKQKDGDAIKGMYFDLNRHKLGDDEDGDEISSLVAEFHDAVASIKQTNKGSKYDALVLNMLQEAMGGQVMEETMREAAMPISGNDRKNATRGIWRAISDLKKYNRIRQGTKGSWMLAD